MLKQRIEQDLKTALRTGDAVRLSVLRSIKSAITYAEVAKSANKRESGLSDDAVLEVLAKEAKKRQESADAYSNAGQPDRADAELKEKKIIQEYLPMAPSEDELRAIIQTVINELGERFGPEFRSNYRRSETSGWRVS